MYNFYQKGNKFKAKKIEVDGLKFDSLKESRRYQELLLLERAGEIKDLQTQVKYVLIPTQREPDTVGVRGGIKKGKTIEKECSYYADFVYTDTTTERTVVEDVKSPVTRTPVYRLKKKLMLFVYGIQVKEI